ncbi:MAG: hypothetical protein GX685_05920 [Clostridiales bacterium]|nr:hypothetical protein [Clostridiales bacterium]
MTTIANVLPVASIPPVASVAAAAPADVASAVASVVAAADVAAAAVSAVAVLVYELLPQPARSDAVIATASITVMIFFFISFLLD